MSDEAQAAFNIYFAQFDPDESEWLDRSTEQIFIDGFAYGSSSRNEEIAEMIAVIEEHGLTIQKIEAENAALKEESERMARELADEKLIVTQKSLHIHDIEGRLNNAEARVAELEKEKESPRFTGYVMFNEDGSIDKESSGIKDIYGLHCGSLDEVLNSALGYFADNLVEIEPIKGGCVTFTAKNVVHQDGQMTFPETGQWDFPPYWEMDISIDEVTIYTKEPANEAKQADNGGILVGDPPTEFTDCWVINSPKEPANEG